VLTNHLKEIISFRYESFDIHLPLFPFLVMTRSVGRGFRLLWWPHFPNCCTNRDRTWNMMEDTFLVNIVKERMCYVSLDFTGDMHETK
jgi:hypothetical protein